MDTDYSRLSYLIEYLGLTQNKFSEKSGLSRGVLSKIANNETKLSVDSVLKIVNTFNVNAHWLLTGKGDPFNTSRQAAQEEPTNLSKVYLLDEDISAAAGMGALATTNRSLESYDYLMMDGLTKSKTYARIMVKGDSMHPTIFDRDLVIACLIEDRLDQALKDHYVYIIVLTSGDILIKRVLNRIKERGKIYLKSDNPSHRSYDLPIQEVAFCWEVKLRTTSNLGNQNLELYDTINRQEERITLIEQTLKKHLKLLN